MRPCLPLLLAITTLGCSDDEPVAFASRLPFDAVVVDGSTSAAYGLRVAGEDRVRLCSGCSVLAKSPAGDHALLHQGEGEFLIAEPGRVNEVLDLASAAVDGAPEELPDLLEATWSPDSKHLALLWGTTQAFVAAADGTRLVPITTGAFDATLSTGGNIDWSPDGSHVAFALGGGALAITDAAGVSSLTLSPTSLAHQWSADGGLFAFENEGVSVVDTATLETRLVSSTATASIGWSVDGAWFAYVDGGLVLAPADDSDAVVLPLDELVTAAWSPVADELVYGGYLEREGPGVDVVLGLWSPERSLSVPIDSNAGNRLPQSVTWSPDGTRFLYRLLDGSPASYSALVDASDGTELARFPSRYDPVPAFNRDGTFLAITSTTVASGTISTDLAVSDASGGDAAAIASKVESWQWLDDGAHLVFVAGRSVAIASADGSQISTRLNVADGAQIELVR